MKTSVLFLVIFAGEVVLGDLPGEWQSWLWGLATGVSLVKLALPLLKE